MSDRIQDIVADLNMKDEDECLALFRVNGITGTRRNSNICLVANYLRAITKVSLAVCGVNCDYAEVYRVNSHGKMTSIAKLSQTVTVIARRFDNGELPEFERPCAK